MSGTVIHNLSNEEYHRGEVWRGYISSSQLKHLQRSPRYFRYMLDHPSEQTDAMRFGSLFHELMAAMAGHRENGTAAIAEWMDGVAVFEPPINEKTGLPYGTATNAYKNAYGFFLSQNEGKIIASKEEVKTASDMAKSLLLDCGATSETVKHLLETSVETESSYFWEDEDGVRLKVRPDMLCEPDIEEWSDFDGVLVDWKTVRGDCMDRESLVRQTIRYGYHISLSMYQWVIHAVSGEWYRPVLVFVSKDAPYESVVCDISEWCIDPRYAASGYALSGPGYGEFIRLLDRYRRCLAADFWPGVEAGTDKTAGILNLEIPAWLENKMERDNERD